MAGALGAWLSIVGSLSSLQPAACAALFSRDDSAANLDGSMHTCTADCTQVGLQQSWRPVLSLEMWMGMGSYTPEILSTRYSSYQ